MSKRPSRRDLFRGAAAGAAAAVPAAAQQQGHDHAAAAAPPAKQVATGPKSLTPHEFKTVRVMSEIIFPGAAEGGAAEYIDLMCSGSRRMADLYTGGLAWIDSRMTKEHGKRFIECTEQQQTALFDLIAYRQNATPELAPGIQFFDWIRKMTADAYYTSKAGIAELEFKGNGARATFDVPADMIEYAVKRSGL